VSHQPCVAYRWRQFTQAIGDRTANDGIKMKINVRKSILFSLEPLTAQSSVWNTKHGYTSFVLYSANHSLSTQQKKT
jgi:hypothetical protein